MLYQKPTFREREEVVHAITGRNRLQKTLDVIHSDLKEIQDRLEEAVRHGDDPAVARLWLVRQDHEKSLREIQLSMTSYEERIEGVKSLMRLEEEKVRWQTKEAMWRRKEWKRYQYSNGLPGLANQTAPGTGFAFLWASVIFLALLIGLALWLK